MKPANIIFIVIDDLGWRDLSGYGSTFHETPRIDRLMAAGRRFDHAYSTSPVCSPTRASILTGRYPARVGITNWIGGSRIGRLREAPYLHWLPLTERCLAGVLAEAGYQTWHVGKWHLGDEPFGPLAHGFAVNHGGCHLGSPQGGYWSPWGIPRLADAAPGTHLTDHLTDLAIDLIAGRDPTRPFFLHLCHYAVHTPIQAPAALIAKYRNKAHALGLDGLDPFVRGEEMPVLPGAGQPMGRVVRRMVQSDPAYAAMLEQLDNGIGRLLDAVDGAGLGPDTLVVFTSDNGGLATIPGSPTCNAPLAEGKGWDREGGVRIPQIVRWTGRIPADSHSAVPVQSCDLFPTALAAAGLAPRPDLHRDGMDLLPLLEGHGEPAPRTLFWHFPHYGDQGGQPAMWALRDGWKLIHRFATGRDELFHLASDPAEAFDQVDRQPGLAADLRARLDAWQRSVEALIPEPEPRWQELRALVPLAAADPRD